MKLGCLYGLWPFLYTGGHWIFEDWVYLSTSLGFNITSFSSDTILIRSKVCVKILRVRRCVQSEIQLSTGVGGLTEEVHRRHRILTSIIIMENKTIQASSIWSFNTLNLRHLPIKTSFLPFPALGVGLGNIFRTLLQHIWVETFSVCSCFRENTGMIDTR